MSRRHHGRSRHARTRADDAARTQAPTESRNETPYDRRADPPDPPDPPVPPSRAATSGNGAERVIELGAISTNGGSVTGIPAPASPAPPPDAEQRTGCTAPQLRRFIKSRPYVPMHELRRRFGINGAEDDVWPLPLGAERVYVGLPERECRLLGELVRGGEVGYELSLDPRTPIVVGVYPMRPVPRA